jgi:hypothetical protein
LDYSELREERMPEILTQIDEQLPFWGTVIPLQTDRLRFTRELLGVAVEMAVFVHMRIKHELACWRPSDRSALVQPMITTPGHGSFPAGHATQAYVVAEVLEELMNVQGSDGRCKVSVRRQLQRIAARISVNRVIAGVHFPVDLIAGRLLGKVLGEYFVFRCWKAWSSRDCTPPVELWHDAGIVRHDDLKGADFDPDRQPFETSQTPYYRYAPLQACIIPPESPLQWLWKAARDELVENDLVFSS